MPLTPAEVHKVAFSKPPLGKRGYHEDEVDAFLDLVAAELARLIGENSDLRTQVERLDAQQQRAAPVDAGPHPSQPVMTPLPPPMRGLTSSGGDYNVRAAKVLGLAQEMADRVTGEAKADADGMLSDARTSAERLLSEATAKAEGMVTEARNRAETMLTDARTKADTLQRQAQDKAAALERDATRKHTETLAALSQEKNTLDKTIDDLRTFERDYRTHLKAYLHSQLRELDGPGSPAPADPEVRAAPGLAASGFGGGAQGRR